MDVMLPTSELPKLQQQDTDHLVAARSQDSVETAIASMQRRQPTKTNTTLNGSTTVAKTAMDATAFVLERGKSVYGWMSKTKNSTNLSSIISIVFSLSSQ